MEITGENPRRVAAHGFYPAWSPDGKRLVACEADFSNPSRMRSVKGQLFVIDAEKGGERVLAKPDFGAQLEAVERDTALRQPADQVLPDRPSDLGQRHAVNCRP